MHNDLSVAYAKMAAKFGLARRSVSSTAVTCAPWPKQYHGNSVGRFSVSTVRGVGNRRAFALMPLGKLDHHPLGTFQENELARMEVQRFIPGLEPVLAHAANFGLDVIHGEANVVEADLV